MMYFQVNLLACFFSALPCRPSIKLSIREERRTTCREETFPAQLCSVGPTVLHLVLVPSTRRTTLRGMVRFQVSRSLALGAVRTAVVCSRCAERGKGGGGS